MNGQIDRVYCYLRILSSNITSSKYVSSPHVAMLCSDSEIASELGPDMVPKLWDRDYEENRRMCAEMILERRENEELDKASARIFI